MSLSLWMLLAYAGWTLTVLVIGVGISRWSLILSGRAKLNDFPGDTPHGSAAYRRATRAHANCIENLPVFAAIVLAAAAGHLTSPAFGQLAVATVAARILQSSIHMLLVETTTMVAWRFTFFAVQLLAMFAMGFQLAVAAAIEPVAWIPRDSRLEGINEAYGCFVSGDSMEPAYERGNLLLVNPTAGVAPGDDCVFVREAADGTRYVLIKRPVRANEQSWTVKQYNPARTYTLPRKEWQKAHLVIGKYNRTS